MPDPFARFTENFTEEAHQVITAAREESVSFNHNYVGTEHLLLGLIRVEPTIASKALIYLRVESHKIHSAIEFIIGRGDRVVLGDVGLTPRAKQVIELARDEANRMGHDTVGPEHLLVGLIREGGGIACGVLESLGCTVTKVRAAVNYVIEHPNEAIVARLQPHDRFRWRSTDMAGVLTFICRDVDKTADFYITYLDADVLDVASVHVYAALGMKRLIQLSKTGPLLALREAVADMANAASDGGGGLELSLFTHDALTVWAKLQARDTPRLSALSEVPGAQDVHMFTLTDPDGRVMRFISVDGGDEGDE